MLVKVERHSPARLRDDFADYLSTRSMAAGSSPPVGVHAWAQGDPGRAFAGVHSGPSGRERGDHHGHPRSGRRRPRVPLGLAASWALMRTVGAATGVGPGTGAACGVLAVVVVVPGAVVLTAGVGALAVRGEREPRSTRGATRPVLSRRSRLPTRPGPGCEVGRRRVALASPGRTCPRHASRCSPVRRPQDWWSADRLRRCRLIHGGVARQRHGTIRAG